MRVLLWFLLVLVSFFSFVFVSTQLGIFQRYPVVHFILALIGIAMLIRLMLQHFTVWRLLATIVSVIVFGFFVWWTLFYSTYSTTSVSVNTGNQISNALSGVIVKTAVGADFDFGEEIAQQPMTLLVFYRGVW